MRAKFVLQYFVIDIELFLEGCIQFIPCGLPQKEGIMTVKKAIIPCAGFGTRFLPATKALPKEILPIVDTPALFYILKEAEASGIEEALIVISPQKQCIKRLFQPNKQLNEQLLAHDKQAEYKLANISFDLKISFAVQRRMDGNANAIALGKKFACGEPFAVLFGDDVMYTADEEPVTKQLINAYESTGEATIVGCQRSSEEIARKCGVMIADGGSDGKITKVRGIVEKPVGELPSRLVSLGRFVLAPDIFDAIPKTPKRDGEIYLTEAIDMLAQSGKPVYACEFDARRYDIGDKEGYLEAITDFAIRDPALSDKYKAYLNKILS